MDRPALGFSPIAAGLKSSTLCNARMKVPKENIWATIILLLTSSSRSLTNIIKA